MSNLVTRMLYTVTRYLSNKFTRKLDNEITR